jgi:hypothetical protein
MIGLGDVSWSVCRTGLLGQGRVDPSRAIPVGQQGSWVDVHLLRSSHPDHASTGCIRGGRLGADYRSTGAKTSPLI